MTHASILAEPAQLLIEPGAPMKGFRDTAEIAVLFVGVTLLLCQSIGLSDRTPQRHKDARQHGLSCMALVDPTVMTDGEGNGPLL